MKYINFFSRISQKSSLYKRLLKKVIPKSIYINIINYINKDNTIRIYTNNRTVTIDSKNHNSNGFMLVSYWDEKPNFGDLIGPYLVSKITDKPVLNICDQKHSGLMTVGSILQSIDRQNMAVWGSGFIKKPTEEVINNIKKYKPDILSVRGKKTANCLIEGGINLPENIVYGDPALILPLFYQPLIKSSEKIGLCPHFIHKPKFLKVIAQNDNLKIIDVQKDMENVVNEISSSSVCISTSLHGLIIAQAYGIPWVWLEISDENLLGDDFKFKDFFSTLREEQVTHTRVKLEDIKELDYASIAKTATLPEKLYDEDLILNSLVKYLDKNS